MRMASLGLLKPFSSILRLECGQNASSFLFDTVVGACTGSVSLSLFMASLAEWQSERTSLFLPPLYKDPSARR